MLAAGALPLLVASPVPLQDWPNHVAGAHVLEALLRGDPFWQRFYQFNTFLVPNAAVDLGLLGLHAAGLSDPAAANVFMLATYGVFVGGMALLSRALAVCDITRIALAILLFYSAALFWGLVNYVLAVGLLWGVLALWLGQSRRTWARLVVAGLGAALLLFVHAIPAVVFPLLLACFDAARLRTSIRLRSLAGLLACGSAPLALLIAVGLLRLLPGNTGHDLAPTYTGAGSVMDFVAWKLRVFATIPFGGSLLQDAMALLALLGCAAAIGLAARPRWHSGAALGIAALFLLTLAAPERVGTGSLLDVRLAALPLMLAAASWRAEWRGHAARRIAVAALAGLVAARTLVIALEWRRADAVMAAFDDEAARLPAGSIMMMGYGRKPAGLSWIDIWSPPILAIAAQSVGHGIFFPALFANPDQQPIALRPVFQSLGQPWDFSDPAHRTTSLAAIAPLCTGGLYSGVFVTVLYSGPPFRIVDACAADSGSW